MKIRYLLLSAFSCVVLAALAFRSGLMVFALRSRQMHEHREAIGSDTIFLGDVQKATRAAETGAWVAGILMLIGICLFTKAIVTLVHRRRMDSAPQ